MNPLSTLRFDGYPKACRPTSILEPLGNAGGFSGARLWRFVSLRGTLVLRSWPSNGPDRSHLEQIHAWLIEAGDLGFLPLPIATLDGRTLVIDDGRFWELTPWLPGSADLARPPTSEHLRAMFAGLAAFHVRLSLYRTDGPSPGLEARTQEIDRLILGEFDHLRAAIDRNPSDPASTLARAWLDRVVRLASRTRIDSRQGAGRVLPLQPCLRDARPDHFLFEDDKLTGLVDFGAMGRDTVAADLARLLAEAVGSDRVARSEALRAYESIRPLVEPEVRSIEAFERANALLGPARWVRWHFLESRVFDEPDAIVRGLRRGLERLDESGL
jgi:Ser/Thr protein kinase RdoA (MazF antagonist)